MGDHGVIGVEQSAFLVKITGPPLNEDQVGELYHAAKYYHAKHKQAAQALKAKQNETKQAQDGANARKKEDLRRLHQKTYVKAHVNAYLKARVRAYQEAQRTLHGSSMEVDEDEDDTEGERDDGNYADKRVQEVAELSLVPRRSSRGKGMSY
jgi:hypothetical protein